MSARETPSEHSEIQKAQRFEPEEEAVCVLRIQHLRIKAPGKKSYAKKPFVYV